MRQRATNERRILVIRCNPVTITISILMVIACTFTATSAQRYFELLPVMCFIATIITSIFLLPRYLATKSITLLFYTICCILKFVLLPVVYSIAPITSISRYKPSLSSINDGILLMIYELVFVSVFVILFTHLKAKNSNSKTVRNRKNKLSSLLSENYLVIYVFIIVAFALLLFYPGVRDKISLGMISANTGYRLSTIEDSSLGVLVRQCVMVGIYSLFIVIAVKCRKGYEKLYSRLYYVISLAVAIAVSMVIVSEARSSQVYCGFAAIMLLTTLYPEKRKETIRILLIAIVIAGALLTVYKTFYAFLYSSYAEALSAASITSKTFTLNLEIYLEGPIHYTALIDLKNSGISFGIGRFLFGFFRTVAGTNMLVKGFDIDTASNLFNYLVTGNSANTGYLMPITGVGYVYLGAILSPLFVCVVYRFAFYLENMIKKSNTAFGIFFVSYVYIRTATCIICTNINTILTQVSFIALTAGVLYLDNKAVGKLIRRHT